jgi:hypothetical protein
MTPAEAAAAFLTAAELYDAKYAASSPSSRWPSIRRRYERMWDDDQLPPLGVRRQPQSPAHVKERG